MTKETGTIAMGKGFHGEQKVKKAELHLSVKRADGTVEDLGVVARYEPENYKEDKTSFFRRAINLVRF